MNQCISIVILLLITGIEVYGQATDSLKSVISDDQAELLTDSSTIQEVSPLDISENRGLYIITPDGQMQLRIVGSVRLSVLYDMVELPIKNSFNTFYIPTGSENQKVTNYFNSLNFSRFGFEVTRKIKEKLIFTRLETDFNGPNGIFRIRHAYGQVGSFLVGQTWSLFSNVSSMPSMVDGRGPTGSVHLRTPQIRYSNVTGKGTKWSLALEYSQPEILPVLFDTIGLSVVQLIPDLTTRIEKKGIFGDVQLSMILNTISFKDSLNQVTNVTGMGGSLSGTLDIDKDHKILYQVTYGKSISHYITTFRGSGTDVFINPEKGSIEPTSSFGGFLSYGWHWNENILTTASLGYARLSDKNFFPGNTYRKSTSFSLDTFWNIVDGARLGFEYVLGQRWNKDNSTGKASRFWILFYYDF